MTEAEWLSCADPGLMLGLLCGKARKRQLRLFAAACCRRIWLLLSDARTRRAVLVAEQHAEGTVADEELRMASAAAYEAADHDPFGYPPNDADAAFCVQQIGLYAAAPTHPPPPFQNAEWDVWNASRAADIAAEAMGHRPCDGLAYHAAERAAQAVLLRCIFGNPFRPVSLDPGWQTPTVLSLAQVAYDERRLPSGDLDATRLAVLADALEDAGCADANLLSHLRLPGPHVRGCWVLDLLLNKP